MSLRYAYSLHERVVLDLIRADDAARSELLHVFGRLASDPAHPGIDTVIDADGRANEVFFSDNFAVVYWADHAVKTVRVMQVQRL
jgi:hypothetical protein